MRETDIEDYLKERVKEEGGLALKFVSPGCTGVPDRVVILPGGKVGFLELKKPGEKPRRDQMHRIRQLRKLGCTAGYADSKKLVDEFLCWLDCQTNGDDILADILEAGGLL
ncbi:MAG: VRR-NUC domain-containing protein [Lachnospiraceae bacterium]